MKHSLFIGRWQPFHDGHKNLIDVVRKEGKKVVIAVRDSEPFHLGHPSRKAWEAQSNRAWPTPRSRGGRTFPGDPRRRGVMEWCVDGFLESGRASAPLCPPSQLSINPLPHFFLPRCIIRSAPVSDTGGPGAKPGEAAILIYD